MILEFDKSFSKSLGRIKDKNTLSKIEKMILNLACLCTVRRVSAPLNMTDHMVYPLPPHHPIPSPAQVVNEF